MSRVLIYRLGSIGDTVVALPAFHLIRRHFERDHITVLTNFWSDQRASSVTSVLPPRLYDDALEYSLATRSVAKLWELRANIRRQRFDVVISLTEQRGVRKSLRDYAFFRACGIRDIRGIPFRRSHFLDHPEPGSELYRSETQLLLDRLRWLGSVDTDDDRWWNLELTEDEHRQARAALGMVGTGTPMLAFSIGTKFDTKDWSQPNWMSLVSRLADRFSDYSLVAIGAADERSRSQELLDLWRGGTVNACGLVPPRVSACILEQARLFVGHDTGPVHLAAAVGTPCVAVYSARSVPGQWFPRGTNHTIFYNKVPCFGCLLETCETFGKKCILSIQPEEVLEAITARLQGRDAILIQRPRNRPQE